MTQLEKIATNARLMAKAAAIFAEGKGTKHTGATAMKKFGFDIEEDTCEIYSDDEMLAIATSERIEVYPHDRFDGGEGLYIIIDSGAAYLA